MTATMAAVQVQLLGAACAKVVARQIDFASDMRFQALAYLAWKGSWVERDTLAFLFWPDTPNRTAQHKA
jgi:DNA-binding SARP family transcriptional activator